MGAIEGRFRAGRREAKTSSNGSASLAVTPFVTAKLRSRRAAHSWKWEIYEIRQETHGD